MSVMPSARKDVSYFPFDLRAGVARKGLEVDLQVADAHNLFAFVCRFSHIAIFTLN